MQLTPRDKRMLQVLGVIAGLALLYFVFTTVLGGDGGGGEVAAPPGNGGVSPTASPTITPSPTPRETLPPVDLVGARDPFSIPPALQVTVTTSGSVGPTGTTTTTPTSTFTTPPPTTPPPTTPPPTTPPPTSPPPTSPPPPPPPEETDHVKIGGHDVQLLSINDNGQRLQVKVDGKVYTVEEGALFAETFKLVNIQGRCARFLFGDQSFTLCERN
ncbi:MAG: hypothetical protein ACXWW5_06135 [Actinomycetota bacterium]